MAGDGNDDPHREANGAALFAFGLGVWLAFGVVYLGWRPLKLVVGR